MKNLTSVLKRLRKQGVLMAQFSCGELTMVQFVDDRPPRPIDVPLQEKEGVEFPIKEIERIATESLRGLPGGTTMISEVLEQCGEEIREIVIQAYNELRYGMAE